MGIAISMLVMILRMDLGLGRLQGGEVGLGVVAMGVVVEIDWPVVLVEDAIGGFQLVLRAQMEYMQPVRFISWQFFSAARLELFGIVLEEDRRAYGFRKCMLWLLYSAFLRAVAPRSTN